MIDILIPTRFSWESIELTIESILKRTRGTEFQVIVADNSAAVNNLACETRTRPARSDDGNRREYLRQMRDEGMIALIEVEEQARCYGHGENLALLCDASESDYAMLLNSNTEVKRGDWLDVLLNLLSDRDKDLGVARERAGGSREHDYICPTYWPNLMLLDMRLYREHFAGHRWTLRQVQLNEFERPELFANDPPPPAPEYDPPLVFADTGWTLWERLHYDNAAGLRILPLPDNYWNSYVIWRGGIDRNSHRPEHPHVQGVLAEVRQALTKLRVE